MAKNDIVIDVEHITKNFKIYYDKGAQLKERLLFRKRNRYEERQVLKDITFQVKRGEAIGLIGHNGCGKSTTLKLLTRIMYPDSGTITMKGRVSSLIELGAGFHPDMSGRENIYINASIFGLTNKEIEERIEEIIDGSAVRTVSFAIVPSHRASPSYLKNAVIGFILGGFISCAWIIIRNLVKQQANVMIGSADDLRRRYPDITVLSLIPDMRLSGKKGYYYSSYYGSEKKGR